MTAKRKPYNKDETVGSALCDMAKRLQLTEDELAKTLEFINEIADNLLPQIDCHCMGLDDARDLLIYCGFGCDELSPEGFIDWLGKKMKEDPRLMDAFLEAKSTIPRERR